MGYTIALIVVVGMIQTQPTDAEIRETKGSFESQGKTIAVEKFEPKSAGRHPAVLILHGAGGMEIGGPEFRDFARELARRGCVAQVVHYFDQTGTVRADAPAIDRLFSTWIRAAESWLVSGNTKKQVSRRPGPTLSVSIADQFESEIEKETG